MMTREDLISSLSQKIDVTLRPLLPHGSACALLDFPNHPNVGDSAIWLGERAYFQRVGARVVYTAERGTYAEDRLRARLRGGTIFLHGGGSLGDLYDFTQHFREKVIAAFPDNKIVQLPQTICFREQANLKRARAILDRHPDLTLLVRDRRSLEFARREFRTPSLLCPDMAFALGALNRFQSPTCAVLWLSRTDEESPGYSRLRTSPDIEWTDWLDEAPTVLHRLNWLLTRLNWLLTRFIPPQPRIRSLLPGLVSPTFDPLARQRLIRGCHLLSKARVVITDRLHGHILSILLGIPHVLLDDRYGKVKAFYETWTRDCGLTYWADSAAEALEKGTLISRV